MGDSNLHLNVATRHFDKRVEKVLEPFVYEWIKERQGSISAEHGLGIAKKKYIGYSRSDTMIELMKQIKKLYDPVSLQSSNSRRCITKLMVCTSYRQPLTVEHYQNGIMNPYKYI